MTKDSDGCTGVLFICRISSGRRFVFRNSTGEALSRPAAQAASADKEKNRITAVQILPASHPVHSRNLREFFRFGEDHDGTEEIAVDFNAEAPALYLGEGLHNGQPQPGADFMPGFVAPDEAFRDFFCGEVQGAAEVFLTLTT